MSASAQAETKRAAGFFDIVFDGPPSHTAGHFVDVEDANGASFSLGEWLKRPDGYWVLRVTPKDAAPDLYAACELALTAFENNNAIDWDVLANALAAARGEG